MLTISNQTGHPALTLRAGAGLALAGANLGLTGTLGPGHQDGILYALEAQDLNLEGTRLVEADLEASMQP